jgi:hypothetical protein
VVAVPEAVVPEAVVPVVAVVAVATVATRDAWSGIRRIASVIETKVAIDQATWAKPAGDKAVI